MESSLLTGISILSGVLILQLIFSPLSQYLNFKLDMAPVFSLKGVLFLVGLFLSISILAGVYPALLLSKIKPLKTISHTNSRSGVLFRRVLVVFQFFVSISLVLSTFIIQKQFSFMKQADLGFQKEELLVLPINARITEQVDSYVSELFRKNLIREASRAGDSPVLVKAQYSMSKNADSENQIAVTGYSGDADLIPTLGLSLLNGNDFSDRDPFMSQVEENGEFPVLINKSGAEALGWEPGEAINKKISFDGLNAYIKGVIEDFHFNSLHKEIGPLVIFLEPNYSSKLLLRITGSNVSLTLQELKSSWNQLIPDRPFSFEFVDQQYQLMYDSEQRLGRIFTLFSTVSIVLSALGLLGLISFLAHQKTKEISIRRVLGAEFAEILKFLAYDFLVLLGFSSLGAVLFGIWFSSSWLKGFAYKTSIPPLIFALAILTVFLVSLSVVSLRIWRIFHQKPIETLNK
ncbi:hypothetical protein Aconfl_33510 [Algoriphagus confluentis]|uniref:ABC3 transporter permease C-terminal domain-containing protein n=2 Tax=Algoriphagus confluentis TaxID=1697556 RepID=A0ABQ6PSL1_9BACT|nr:hypothetical protein Aconfl_33510 [Algoriphagus confluentis]